MGQQVCPTTGKVAYPNENAARRAARGVKLRINPKVALSAYRCNLGHWHIGNGSDWGRRVKLARKGWGMVPTRTGVR